MKEKANIKKELEQLTAKRLAVWQGHASTKQLSGTYLDRLSEQAIATAKQKEAVPKKLRPSFLKIGAVAAGFLLLLAGSWVFFRGSSIDDNSTETQVVLDEVSDDQIKQYIVANLDDFDLALLSDYADILTAEEFLDVQQETDQLDEFLEENSDWLMNDEEIELF